MDGLGWLLPRTASAQIRHRHLDLRRATLAVRVRPPRSHHIGSDSVYAFQGSTLVGGIRAACVFFTDAAAGAGPPLPIKHLPPAKVPSPSPPVAAYKLPKPARVADASRWSLRSGEVQFFRSIR